MVKKKRGRPSVDKSLEVEDEINILHRKCQKLANFIKSANCTMVYTGAGISTAAAIPDYRGPNGLWTMAGKGIQPTKSCNPIDCEPTICHMALREMSKRGFVRHILSQNCDGLHLRSGLPQRHLSEIHGNMHVEVCTNCTPNRQYIRAFDVTAQTRFRRHNTERRCDVCNALLRDTIVHFGEWGKLDWPLNWRGATRMVNEECDLIICLGTSLQILNKYPFLWADDRPARERPKLVIVNLQWTPRDRLSDLKISGRCDYVMNKVMQLLQLPIPPYCRLCDPVLNNKRRSSRNCEVMDKVTECACEVPTTYGVPPDPATNQPSTSTTHQNDTTSASPSASESQEASSSTAAKHPGWWSAGLSTCTKRKAAVAVTNGRNVSATSDHTEGDGSSAPLVKKRKRGRPRKVKTNEGAAMMTTEVILRSQSKPCVNNNEGGDDDSDDDIPLALYAASTSRSSTSSTPRQLIKSDDDYEDETVMTSQRNTARLDLAARAPDPFKRPHVEQLRTRTEMDDEEELPLALLKSTELNVDEDNLSHQLPSSSSSSHQNQLLIFNGFGLQSSSPSAAAKNEQFPNDATTTLMISTTETEPSPPTTTSSFSPPTTTTLSQLRMVIEHSYCHPTLFMQTVKNQQKFQLSPKSPRSSKVHLSPNPVHQIHQPVSLHPPTNASHNNNNDHFYPRGNRGSGPFIDPNNAPLSVYYQVNNGNGYSMTMLKEQQESTNSARQQQFVVPTDNNNGGTDSQTHPTAGARSGEQRINHVRNDNNKNLEFYNHQQSSSINGDESHHNYQRQSRGGMDNTSTTATNDYALIAPTAAQHASTSTTTNNNGFTMSNSFTTEAVHLAASGANGIKNYYQHQQNSQRNSDSTTNLQCSGDGQDPPSNGAIDHQNNERQQQHDNNSQIMYKLNALLSITDCPNPPPDHPIHFLA